MLNTISTDMVSVALVSLSVVVVLQAAARPAAAEECQPLGALRLGPSEDLSACTAREGWLRVSSATSLRDLPLLWSRTAPDCTGQAGQMLCDSTCGLVGVCLATGQWFQTQDCSPLGQVCREGKCIVDDGSPCQPLEGAFCQAVGSFPSLTDCSRYYDCQAVGSEGTEVSCPDGTFYDACTGQCDVEANGDCEWAISKPCEEAGAFGVPPNNDRIYYVCLPNAQGDAVPWWYRCTTGHFNTNTLQCENKDVLGCVSEGDGGATSSTTTTTTTAPPADTTTVKAPEPDTTITTTTTVPTTTTSTTTTTTQSPVFKCQTAGVNANPLTNCSLYYCYPDGTYVLVTCRDGFHFEPASGACEPGQCTP